MFYDSNETNADVAALSNKFDVYILRNMIFVNTGIAISEMS